MSLEKFGWNSYFANEFLRLGIPGAEPARVGSASQIAGACAWFPPWNRRMSRPSSALIPDGTFRHEQASRLPPVSVSRAALSFGKAGT